MIVCILNPNQQLQINNFQKEFIKSVFPFCTKIIKNYQNMISINFFKNFSTESSIKNLTSFSNSIKNITIFEPQIKPFSNDFLTPFYNIKQSFDFTLSSKIELVYDDKIDNFDFPLVFFNLKDNKNLDFTELNKKNSTNIFPLKIKIFRLGKCLCKNNTYILDDFIWKKLK